MNKKKILIIIGICVLIAGAFFGINKFKDQQARNKVKEYYNLTDEDLKNLSDEEIKNLASREIKVEKKQIEKPKANSANELLPVK